LQGILRKIKDVPRLLVRLSNMAGSFKAQDFQSLKESMANLVLLRDTLVTAHKVCVRSTGIHTYIHIHTAVTPKIHKVSPLFSAARCQQSYLFSRP
jgi:hypothetical protein